MPRIVQAPAQGARQLAAMSLGAASQLRDRSFDLRRERLQELKWDRDRLLRIMSRIRAHEERKKAGEVDKGVFGGWGSTAGTVAGTVAGIPGGPATMLAGAQIGAAAGGGIDMATSGDLRGGTASMTRGFETGLEQYQNWQPVPNRWDDAGGGQTGSAGFGGTPGPG